MTEKTKKNTTKMTTEEKIDWDNLYQYVRSEIMGYDKTIRLPNFMVMRLKGLNEGKFFYNKSQEPQAKYDYKIILYTFKICKAKILQYLISNNTKFTNEQHKFNSIMIFIENEINDVVLRLKNAKCSQEKTENLNIENQFNKGVEYKKKNSKINDKLNDLW